MEALVGNSPSRARAAPMAINESSRTTPTSFGLIAASFMTWTPFNSTLSPYLEGVILTTAALGNRRSIDPDESLWHKKLCLLHGYSSRSTQIRRPLMQYRIF